MYQITDKTCYTPLGKRKISGRSKKVRTTLLPQFLLNIISVSTVYSFFCVIFSSYLCVTNGVISYTICYCINNKFGDHFTINKFGDQMYLVLVIISQ